MFAHREGLTLALGGGGARGFAHVGVMEVLAEKGVKVAGIVGTSSGSIAGAGLACGFTTDQMRQRIAQFASSKLVDNPRLKNLSRGNAADECRSLSDRLGRFFCQGRMVKSLFLDESVVGGDFFKDMVEFFLPDVNIEDLVIPFTAVAADIMTGEQVIFSRGSLHEAVLASCSVPGAAPPVERDGRYLADGGVVSLVPADVARRLGAGKILAVRVDRDMTTDEPPRHALEFFIRSGEIQGDLLSRLQLEQADLVISPRVGGLHWVDFAEHDWIVEQGVEAARRCWPLINELVRRRQWPWRRRTPVVRCGGM